jgi:predicted DNA binding CopG/RHH family protein
VEEARFWKTHSVTDYLGELTEVRGVGFPKPRKKLVSMRVDDATIKSVKEVAQSRGVGYLTLMRMWIIERLSRERRALRTHHG